jgi:hypothetical protein
VRDYLPNESLRNENTLQDYEVPGPPEKGTLPRKEFANVEVFHREERMTRRQNAQVLQDQERIKNQPAVQRAVQPLSETCLVSKSRGLKICQSCDFARIFGGRHVAWLRRVTFREILKMKKCPARLSHFS